MELSIAFIILFFGLEGLAIGSFLNVVIDRLPREISLRGRSHCDGCNRKLAPMELIPVYSYVMQKGKSLCCQKPLSIQYPIIELCTGVIFALLTYWYSAQVQIIDARAMVGLVGLLATAAVTIAIVLIDWSHQIIPDNLQVALFLSIVGYLWGTGVPFNPWTVGHALAVTAPILLIYLFTRGRGMGFGDVKLMLSIGLWLGLGSGWIAIYIAFIVGALYGVSLMTLRKAHRTSHIAFGPFLLFGAWVSFFAGEYFMKLLFAFL